MSTNKKLRKVTAVFSDAYHTLHLVEVTTYVKMVPSEDMFHYRVDKNKVEEYARLRMKETGKEDENADGLLRPYKYDLVGILVAHDDPLAKGRISWAEEVETQEAVEL